MVPPGWSLLYAAFGVLSLLALAGLLRAERRHFLRRGKAWSWLWVRLGTVPIALATAALALLPARAASGMDALAVFYMLLLTAAPAFWFGAHWLLGRLVQPALTADESAWVAASPLLLAALLSAVAHALQPYAWQLLKALAAS